MNFIIECVKFIFGLFFGIVSFSIIGCSLQIVFNIMGALLCCLLGI